MLLQVLKTLVSVGGTSRVLRLSPLLAAWAALVAACGSEPREADVLVYDSAGIRIAESTSPGWSTTTAWQVAHAPQVTIGVTEGADEYQFTRINGVWRRDDGSVVVGDQGSSEIRVYNADGTFVKSFGGEGDGPGEFRHLSHVAPYRGDSIVVWDTRVNRLSVFDREGSIGRTQRIVLETAQDGTGERSFGISETFWGTFDDGSLAFAPRTILFYEEGDPLVFRRPIIRLSPEGDSLDVLGTFAVAEIRGLDQPFPRMETVTVAGGRVYAGGGEGYELEVWRADGTLERIVRIAGRELPVDDGALEVFSAWYRDRYRDEPEERVENALAGASFPSHLPPYSAVVLDARDHLWVEDYHLDSDPRPAVWNVFDPDGRWLGSVQVPPYCKVHQIGSDFVLGVRTDQTDVPFVESYPLSTR